MKERVISVIIVFCIIVIIILSAVNSSSVVLAELKTIEGVEMRIKEGTLTNKSATIVIENMTDIAYVTGRKYKIDKNIDGNWYQMKMKEDMLTTADGLLIKNGNPLEMDLNWERYYGQLEPGKYRIVKGVSEENDNHFIEYSVAVEFVIE